MERRILSPYDRIVDTPRIIRLLLVITSAATSLVGAIFWIIRGWQETTLTLLMVSVLAVLLLTVLRKGLSVLAGLVLYLAVSSMITFNISIGHGIYDEGMLVYPLLITFSGLIFGKRSAVLVSGISIAQISLIYLFAEAGQVQPFDGAVMMTLEDTITTCVILLATGFLVWVIIDIVENAVDRIYRSEENLENAYKKTLIAWAKALEMREREVPGHSARVSSLTSLFAEHLDLPPVQIKAAWQGALLHDVGKMGIPEDLLLKEDAFNDEERKLVKSHTILGEKLIEGIDYLDDARKIISSHHERYDGKGYPAQLKKDQIPYLAQLFAIVDCWDTLRSSRPCRPSKTDAQALEYIQNQAGRKFHPELVNQFVDLVLKYGLEESV